MSAVTPVQPAVKVGVGITTLAGYGATLVGVIGIILVQLLKVDEEQATLIATAVWTVVSFAITQLGRYAQAKELAKKARVPATFAAIDLSEPGSSPDPGEVVFATGSGSAPVSMPSSLGEMDREPKYTPPESHVDIAHEQRDIHEIDEILERGQF